ncbi:L-seryl-tRNA(Sec) selenium transferase, partial [Campylobacter coli]|nr:L-seryl-tRNA(Sec) selenium transferase [Campylobacter coli]
MNKFRTFPQIGSLIDDESLKEYPFYLRSYFCKSVVAKLKANISEDLLDKNTILEKIQ